LRPVAHSLLGMRVCLDNDAVGTGCRSPK
jgi:hypothetical protein